MFPLSHGQILGSLFKNWNLPNALCLPFNFVSKPFSALVSLSEPMRTKVELLKLSIMIGQIALGEWEAWDAIDFPTSSVLKRLQLESIAKIIEDTRAEMKILFGEQCDGEQANNAQTAEPSQPEIKKSLGYCNLSAETFDFLRAIVATMGIDLTECVPNILEPNRNFLVNCLWNPPQKFNSIFSPGKPCYGAKLMVADPNHVTFYESAGKVITLPTNFGTLQSACDEIARHE
jgi:hypothetical protein